MTATTRGRSSGRLVAARMLVPLGAAAALAGCAQPPPPPPGPSAIVYSADLQGAAQLCTAPRQLVLAEGKPTEAAIVVGNDGGWCAIAVAMPGPEPKPYGAGLLNERPAHGKVYIHPVGNTTRIDYTPTPGYAGADRFAVELLPGAAVLRVGVTVQPPARPALLPPARPALAPPRR